MSELKKRLVKSMDKIMLNCDQATLLATQNSIDKISCLKKVQLQMHLLGCKFCRTYVEQSKQISVQLDQEKEINPDELKIHLTVVQKDRMQTSIDENIN
jgi:hypothetical protein